MARYYLTRVELKTFTFSAGSQSLSIDNAVLGRLPKRLLFAMAKKDESRHGRHESLQLPS